LINDFRHADAMITNLKKAGLGYNVKEKDTKDRFGKIIYLYFSHKLGTSSL